MESAWEEGMKHAVSSSSGSQGYTEESVEAMKSIPLPLPPSSIHQFMSDEVVEDLSDDAYVAQRCLEYFQLMDLCLEIYY